MIAIINVYLFLLTIDSDYNFFSLVILLFMIVVKKTYVRKFMYVDGIVMMYSIAHNTNFNRTKNSLPSVWWSPC